MFEFAKVETFLTLSAMLGNIYNILGYPAVLISRNN